MGLNFNRFFIIFIVLFGHYAGLAQNITEKLIVKDRGDSLVINAYRKAFDSAGHYYYETLKGRDESFVLHTDKKKYPTAYWSKNLALEPYKALLADAFFTDTSHSHIWYKNKMGTHVYGPHAGRVREILEFGRENIAMELCVGSKSYLYINDTMVNMTDSANQRWMCSFSNNGNVIYSYKHKAVYKLYVNGKLVDTSATPFSNISVNDNKFYTYVKCSNSKLYVHTPSKTFGPLGKVDNCDLWNSDAYYFSGCQDSSCYVLVNDKLFAGIPEAHSWTEDPAGEMEYRSSELITVKVAGSNNFVFTYNKNDEDGFFANVNGNVQPLKYTYIGNLTIDEKGNYACYGFKTDTLGIEKKYRVVNGKEKKLPFFKKGPHVAHCIQISPDGGSFYYCETQDSIYMYHNDTLLCKPAQKRKFLAWDASILPQIDAEGTETFNGFNFDGNAYIVFNNTVSRPLPMVNTKYDQVDPPAKGCIVASGMNGKNFFIVLQTAPGKYLLDINNQVYKELNGIDNILNMQSYLTDKSVVIYGLKRDAYYQFSIDFK